MDEKKYIKESLCENEEMDTNPEDNEETVDDDHDHDHDDTEHESIGSGHIGRKPLNGPPCSLKTLVNDGILQPAKHCLTIEYMGAKFTADLLPSGNIRWSDTKQIFNTPSAWVNHCRKIVNPENKSGSAWSAIRYNGKRLDSYKLRWYRKQKKIATNKSDAIDNMMLQHEHPKKSDSVNDNLLAAESLFNTRSLWLHTGDVDNHMNDHNVIEHSQLKIRSLNSNMNTMVKCTHFSSLDRIQPFTITLSTNALLLIDFHCHLTHGEVVGYLGGTWDIATHNLAIVQAFPCRSRLRDKDNASLIEEEIRQALDRRHLNVVGWYHSHPYSAPQPSIKDIDSQMEYQILMKGESDSSYIPCVGLISSPFYEMNEGMSASFQFYWVMPPNEYKPQEYGKPMKMTYTVSRDSFLTQDLLLEMRLLAHFYTGASDFVNFKEKFKSGETYWEKLQISLKSKLPRDLQMEDGQSHSQTQVQQQALTHFWAFIKGLILP